MRTSLSLRQALYATKNPGARYEQLSLSYFLAFLFIISFFHFYIDDSITHDAHLIVLATLVTPILSTSPQENLARLEQPSDVLAIVWLVLATVRPSQPNSRSVIVRPPNSCFLSPTRSSIVRGVNPSTSTVRIVIKSDTHQRGVERSCFGAVIHKKPTSRTQFPYNQSSLSLDIDSSVHRTWLQLLRIYLRL
jgi:hypothetical protein